MKLPLSFYLADDVVQLAQMLIGCSLHTNFNGLHKAVLITETEAYAGINDRASHAWNGRFTKRIATMYKQGGIAYVYLCYGIHHLFNIVTAAEGTPHAILIRGGIPLSNALAKQQPSGYKSNRELQLNGPGKLSKDLGISVAHNGISLLGDHIWVEAAGFEVKDTQILRKSRVGIDYAGEDAGLPYRFVFNGA